MRSVTIARWMGTPLLGLPRDAPMQAVAQMMVQHRLRHVPLWQADGRVLGVVSDVDVFAAGTLVDDGLWVERLGVTPAQLARPAAAVVHPDDELAAGLAAMVDARSDYALVLRDDGMAVGIFTEHDAVRVAARLLPERAVCPVHHVVRGVQASARVADAIEQMVAAGVRHLVVMRGGALDGVVSIRDLMAADQALRVEDATPPGLVRTMPVHSSLRQVAAEMKRLKIGSMIAVDEGTPVSVITRTDIVRLLLALLDANEATDPGAVLAR